MAKPTFGNKQEAVKEQPKDSNKEREIIAQAVTGTVESVLDDELPLPVGTPMPGRHGEPPVDQLPDAPAISSGTLSDDQYGQVEEGQPVLPKGTYRVRADSYDQHTDSNGTSYFTIRWVVQDPEIHSGRKVWETYVAWITPELVTASGDPSSPDNARGRNAVKNLWKAKAIMKAAGWQGPKNFQQFLDSNPEVRVSLKLEERKAATGKVNPKTGKKIYAGTGKPGNRIDEYLPLG